MLFCNRKGYSVVAPATNAQRLRCNCSDGKMTVSISQWAYPEGGPPHVAVTTSPGVSSAVITMTNDDWLEIFRQFSAKNPIAMIFPMGDMNGDPLTVDDFFQMQAVSLWKQYQDVDEVARRMGINENQLPRLKLICEMETQQTKTKA